MIDHDDRYDRNVRLFGTEGQARLRRARVAVIGAGGIGTHVVQQLALLGVGSISVVDHEELAVSNKNRYIGAVFDDPVPGTKKVEIAKRVVTSINPSIKVEAIHANLVSHAAFSSIKAADHVFGCLDSDGARFVLNDLVTAYAKPYIDVASDVADGSFGGRVVANWSGDGCLYCFCELDQIAVQEFLANKSDRVNYEAVYGIARSMLSEAGPSVVSINGVVASLAVTEYMAVCTGLRAPVKFINYDGRAARASPRQHKAHPNCAYCTQWGVGDSANVERYLARTDDT